VKKNEAIEQKDTEISYLKEEIAALKEKTKAQMDKVMQFKNKVSADLKTAKEDCKASQRSRSRKGGTGKVDGIFLRQSVWERGTIGSFKSPFDGKGGKN